MICCKKKILTKKTNKTYHSEPVSYTAHSIRFVCVAIYTALFMLSGGTILGTRCDYDYFTRFHCQINGIECGCVLAAIFDVRLQFRQYDQQMSGRLRTLCRRSVRTDFLVESQLEDFLLHRDAYVVRLGVDVD